MEAEINVDAEIDINDVTKEFVMKIRKLAPFGNGFEKPKFLIRNVNVKDDKIIREKHHIMTIENGSNSITAVKWGIDAGENMSGKIIDLVCSVSLSKDKGIKLEVEQFEIAENSTESVNINVEDYREKEHISENKDEFVFGNGYSQDVIDCYNFKESEILSLVSIPYDLELFADLLKQVQPKTVRLYFKEDKRDLSEILKYCVGIIKGAEEGEISVNKLSSVCNVSVSLMFNILDYLAAEDVIKYIRAGEIITVQFGKYERDDIS